MGLSLLTLRLVFSPFATCRAMTTYTTTPLRSLADPGGVFDAPTEKCPPDRGSSDWVRDSPASITPIFPIPTTAAASFHSDHTFSFSSSSSSSSFPETTVPTVHKHLANSIVYPPTPPPENGHDVEQVFAVEVSAAANLAPTAPQPILNRAPTELATPPLTPDEGVEGEGSLSAISAAQNNDFLATIFPRNGLSALPRAKSVSIKAPTPGAASFDGVVLELPGKPKTFYVDGKSADNVNLRESIVALLDLADEQLDCQALVIALERSSPVLGDLLHSLMYAGGTVVTKAPFQVDPSYVLVGLEI